MVVRKARVPLSASEALEWIEQFPEFPCQAVDHRIVRIAIEVSERFRISYWDAAIIAAAEGLSREIVYSEDLNSGSSMGRCGL